MKSITSFNKKPGNERFKKIIIDGETWYQDLRKGLTRSVAKAQTKVLIDEMLNVNLNKKK